MVEFNAHSMFGKHAYAKEQFGINLLGRQIDQAIALVEPLAIGIAIPLDKLPADWRRRKVKVHLEKAKHVLVEIGV